MFRNECPQRDVGIFTFIKMVQCQSIRAIKRSCPVRFLGMPHFLMRIHAMCPLFFLYSLKMPLNWLNTYFMLVRLCSYFEMWKWFLFLIYIKWDVMLLVCCYSDVRKSTNFYRIRNVKIIFKLSEYFNLLCTHTYLVLRNNVYLWNSILPLKTLI